jgi:predicted RNA methylase
MFAADAGAIKVYAVELDHGNIAALKRSISVNGFNKKIITIEGDATNIHLPEKVDVVICEMIATGLIEELQVPVMNHILQFTTPATKVLLEGYETSVELVYSKNIFYGKKFDVIRFELPEMRDMRSKSFTDKLKFINIDFTKVNKLATKKTLIFDVTSNGTINAVKVTGVTKFCDNSHFEDSTSYSFPILLPTEDVDVKKGDKIKLVLAYVMGTGPQTLKYSISRV